MTLRQLGFDYLGRCACAGKPERWSAPKRMELKKWNNGSWKLLRSGLLVRHGIDPNSIEDEVTEYMEKNNLL